MSWLKKLDVHHKEWFMLGAVALSLITSLIVYPMMPKVVASHWDAVGKVNGYMSAFWGTFIMPLMFLGIFLLMMFISRKDPMKENIQKFKEYFLNFVLILFLLFYSLQIFTILWNLGYKINIIYVIIPMFAILFFYTGVMLSKAEQNMSIGIRTPWTLKSKSVWDKTHKKTAVLLKFSSILFLLGLIFRKYAFIILLGLIIAVFIWAFFYSFFIYEKEKNGKEKENNSAKLRQKKH